MWGSHRQVIGTTVVGSELLFKVGQGEKGVAGVEAFLVLPVAALHLAVVPGRVRPDELVADAQFGSGFLEKSRDIPLAVGETVGELKAVVGLDALYTHAPAGKPFHHSL